MIRTIQLTDYRRALEMRREMEARAGRRAKKWEGPLSAIFVGVLAAVLLWLGL